MIRLSVRAPSACAELVLAALVELSPAGVEESERDGMTEFSIYGAPGELPDLGDAQAEIGGVEVEVRSSEVGDDWAERWKRFHQPVEIGGRVRVRPPWFDAHRGFEDIVIDPGQAFGTAAHPTTRMCCQLLLELAADAAGGPLVDLGTGSGVLAIVATRLGWRPVCAIDHEPAALDAARRNADANGGGIEFRHLDLRREAPPPSPVIVANLTAGLLVDVASRYEDGLRPPEQLICSGMLTGQEREVESAFRRFGLAPSMRLRSGDWSAMLMKAGAAESRRPPDKAGGDRRRG